MLPVRGQFQRSIDRQIAINQARSPTQRLDALCELLDTARELAPVGPEAQARRLRAAAVLQLDRERWRVRCRQYLAAQRPDAQTGA